MSITRQRTNMNNHFHSMVRNFMGHDNRFARIHAPQLDLKETEDGYEVIVDLPGFKKEDIKVTVTKDSLELKTSVETKEENEEENYLHRERCARDNYRRVSFRNQIDIENVKTELTDGVLTINLPKSEDDGKRIVEL